MNVSRIEENLQALAANLDEETFIYDLLLAYGLSKSAITRLKTGSYNVATGQGEVLWKKKVFFKKVVGQDLHATIDGCRRDPSITRHSPRFIIVMDLKTLLAVDTKTDDTLDIPITELNRHYDFFLPWVGREKAQIQIENPADVKAASKLAVLYDEIFKDNAFNPEDEPEKAHALNVFLCRLLFCFFAEDTEIFKEQACFTHSLKNQTQEDGSDVSQHLERLFEVLSLPEDDPKRRKYPAFLQSFPWVNGGLFEKHFEAPNFSKKSRKLLLEAGELDWSAINPDIFGSMMQAVVRSGKKSDELQRHYTSVPNILKVIKPLFLDGLYEELVKSSDDPKKLQKLHQRLTKIRVFDPACGSGNFLIISYKELRKVEIEIFKAMEVINGQKKFTVPLSSIALTQFYGIEIDDFAHEVAMLSLWLAEHQMNVAFKNEFGKTNPSLPLKKGGNIKCDNATRINWESVCPKDTSLEIYLIGNPPYYGSFLQNKEQKEDLAFVCRGFSSYKDLDYISCWFLKGSDYVSGTSFELAFVTTDSITQGEQVALLWPHIFNKDIEIGFAHQSFKWRNNAKDNAGVTCAIIGLRSKSAKQKSIYNEASLITTENISPYLIPGKNIFIKKRVGSPLSQIPKMSYGNKVVDDGNLIIQTKEEKDVLIEKHPQSSQFIKRLMGSSEFLKGKEKWCIWVNEEDYELARTIPPLNERFKKVAEARAKSTEKSTREMAQYPYRFYFISYQKTDAIIIPETSSSRREYIPIGFIDSSIIITNKLFAIYNPEPWNFGIVSSKMHMTWVYAVGGKRNMDPSYSSGLCYNTFPFPEISNKQKEIISTHVFDVLSEREKYPERTLAELYDPDKMPDELRESHRQLDVAVEQCYRIKPFTSDEERLEHLFKLYEEMTSADRLVEVT